MHRARLPRAALAGLTLLSAGWASAADTPPIKPGLWEMTTESQRLNGEAMPDHSAMMAEQLKNMPPEMRKQMEAQMKARGVQMAPAQGGGHAVRMCLTEDMLKQNRWQRSDGQCDNQVVKRSGNTWHWKVTCRQPASQGEGTTTFTSPEAYSGEMRMTTDVGGQAQTMTMKHRARRISADCGAVKPMQAPARP